MQDVLRIELFGRNKNDLGGAVPGLPSRAEEAGAQKGGKGSSGEAKKRSKSAAQPRG